MEPLDVPCPACHARIGAPCTAVKRGTRKVKVPASGHHIVRASKAAAVTSGHVRASTARVTRTEPPRKGRQQAHSLGSPPATMLSKSQRVVLGGRLRVLSYATYSDYLRGAHWQHFSTMVATPYRNCHVCGRSGSALHHPDYSTLGRERPDDVVPLCEDHHEIVHRVHVLERRPLAHCHVIVRQRAQEGALLIQPRTPSRSPAR